MSNKFNLIGSAIKLFSCMILMTLIIVGCQDEYRYDLPDSNSKEDTIGPGANFVYASTLDDFKAIKFTNLSSEATTYLWDFGGGSTSTDQDPTFTFPGEGTYEVTLTATDGLGVSSSTTIEVIVKEVPFQSIIVEAGFEDGTLPDGTGDGRDSWKNSDLGGVIQITTDPVATGLQGAKLPSAGDRIGYQEIAVQPDINYDLRFLYTMKSGTTNPQLVVSVLGVSEFGPFADRQEAQDGTIASITVSDDSEPDVYVEQKLSFNSGTNDIVAIYFYNANVEARLDEFTIEVGPPGSVGPSASFDIAQGETVDDYLEYTFTNTSKDGATYLWDFGDGMTSTEESPVHVYAEAGTYIVTLTVRSAIGLSSSLEQTIIINAPVTAGFECTPDPDDYRTIMFMDASIDASMLLWEFGDGFQYTGMDASHTYAEDGTYMVTLTAFSLTGSTDVITKMVVVAQGFIVQVLNGTFDEYTSNTGDNADAWDMTPNSTVVDNSGTEIPSPYDPLWDNGALDSWLDAFFMDDSEQPASTSDGNNGTRGAKMNEASRRLYQVVLVEQGTEYTFSIDTRSEAMGVNTEVYILNTQIEDEVGINASSSDPAIDAYFEVTNDFNTDKTVFTTNTFTFTPTTSEIVIYVRSVDSVDSSNEVFIDNITIQ